MKALLYTVVVDNYVREIVLSKSIRAKYIKFTDKKDLPLKYCDKKIWKEDKKRVISTEYCWTKVGKDKVLFLYKRDGMEKQISNNLRAGKERVGIINGQDLHRLTLPDYMASKIKKAIKQQFVQYIQHLSLIKVIPLIVDVELRDTYRDELQVTNPSWDVDNRLLFYRKVFNDVLCGCPSYKNEKEGVVYESKRIIKDDHRGFITGGSELFTPIKEDETRQLIFKIYHDQRKVVEDFKYKVLSANDFEGENFIKQNKQTLLLMI